jgi:hypothetical protein
VAAAVVRLRRFGLFDDDQDDVLVRVVVGGEQDAGFAGDGGSLADAT